MAAITTVGHSVDSHSGVDLMASLFGIRCSGGGDSAETLMILDAHLHESKTSSLTILRKHSQESSERRELAIPCSIQFSKVKFDS